MTSHFTKRFSTIRTMRKFRFALQIHGIRCEFAFFTLLSIDDSRYGDVCVCVLFATIKPIIPILNVSLS